MTDTSAQIAAFKAAAGTSYDPALPINGAFVTYIKPLVGTDVAGFFLQAEATGPAMFVAVDPGTLQVGDRVNLSVSGATVLSGQNKAATTISGLTVVSQFHPVRNLNTATPAGLVVDQSSAPTTELLDKADTYFATIARMSGTLNGASATSGTGHVAFTFRTAGINNANLKLRVTEDIAADLGLVDTCAVTLAAGPLWKFTSTATPPVTTLQPSAYFTTDLTGITCPAPTLTGAIATSLTEVKVSFSRPVDAASLTNVPAQFTFTNGIQAQSATVSGKDVYVKTTEQVAGTDYAVSATTSVKDTVGGAVVIPNTASFKGFRVGAVLRITEVQPSASNNLDLVELQVLTGGTTAGIQLLQDVNSPVTLATMPDVAVAAGDIIVVHIASTTDSETTSKNQFPTSSTPANYDTAWDFKGGATGITFSSRVILVRNAQDQIQDAVPFTRNSGTPPAAFPGNLQAIQAAGQWLPADCGGALCSTTTTPTAAAVSADWTTLPTSNATPASPSIRRVSTTDTNTKDDWAVGASSWGVANP
ncbi:hypothetical protein FOF48_18250 [Corallococcus sp. Z5C101001]|nr:hypothetical protein FOF48_18250 [Corallococcus sp. Z5C101001]